VEAGTPQRRGHAVLVGYGRVGRIIARGLAEDGGAFVLIEEERDLARQAEADGLHVVAGNAADPRVLEEAGIGEAARLLVAIPEGFEGGAIAEHALALNPSLRVVARAHSDQEVEHLERMGAQDVVMGERETAARMLALALSPEARSSGHAA
jgi:CPA2 family monovalent cation:H+ antiporter-2